MIQPCVIRILSVDDHPLFREGIAAVIKNQSDMLLVAEAASGAEALRQFREHRPDVTLMELRLPDSSGIEAMIAIRTHFPEARVILVATFEGDVEIHGAMQAGAWGYIFKTMPPREMVEMIRQVYAGRKCAPPPIAAHPAEHLGGESLTSRELEILARVAGGYRNRDMWQRLFISEDAVKYHLKQIVQKLGARDRTNALTKFVARPWWRTLRRVPARCGSKELPLSPVQTKSSMLVNCRTLPPDRRFFRHSWKNALSNSQEAKDVTRFPHGESNLDNSFFDRLIPRIR
jgi:DNA-binding NarL/FixJ family response regulator